MCWSDRTSDRLALHVHVSGPPAPELRPGFCPTDFCSQRFQPADTHSNISGNVLVSANKAKPYVINGTKENICELNQTGFTETLKEVAVLSFIRIVVSTPDRHASPVNSTNENVYAPPPPRHTDITSIKCTWCVHTHTHNDASAAGRCAEPEP